MIEGERQQTDKEREKRRGREREREGGGVGRGHRDGKHKKREKGRDTFMKKQRKGGGHLKTRCVPRMSRVSYWSPPRLLQ
jgi:hypothetical protein